MHGERASHGQGYKRRAALLSCFGIKTPKSSRLIGVSPACLAGRSGCVEIEDKASTLKDTGRSSRQAVPVTWTAGRSKKSMLTIMNTARGECTDAERRFRAARTNGTKVACSRRKSMLRSWRNGEVGPGCG
jgi:hypothetical protein